MSDPEPPTADAATPPASGGSPDVGRDPQDPLRGSRTSGVWLAIAASAVLLVLLVVFIIQNTQSVQVSYFGWEGTAPLAAALLIAAVAGLVLALMAGSLRLLQVRRRVKRERR